MYLFVNYLVLMESRVIMLGTIWSVFELVLTNYDGLKLMICLYREIVFSSPTYTNCVHVCDNIIEFYNIPDLIWAKSRDRFVVSYY